MTDGAYDGDSVVEKLSKLNSSQQSIESLSRYCVSHRKKARQVVEFWDKAFNNAQKEQRVSFLYLANDILQNSRRKGSEFVNEFWKVLPAALKYVYQNGDEYAKKTAHRLVDIWEERKVFGSRGRNLKDDMLGKDPPLPAATTATSAASNGKSANPIKIVKRDSHSLRIKLAVGGLPEKIITSFQLVHDEISIEEGALSKCKAAASLVGKMEKDVEYAYNQGNVQGNIPVLVDEMLERENEVTSCINQLENAEATRAALVSQLKEAVEEQESKLELVRSQLQVSRGQIDQISSMRQRLTPPTLSAQPNNPPLSQTVIPFSPLKLSEEESKKAAAAAVAAKLAASTSSAQMLTSILSSLVAEEAASKSSGLIPPGFPVMPLNPPPEKRQKMDTPVPTNDNNNSEMGSTMNYFAQMAFPPLPPPPIPTTNSPTNQFVPSSGMMMGIMPYGYGSSALQPPPPPPLPSHIAMGLARPPQQPPQPQSQSPQSSNGGGYYRPPGIGFYGQNQAATPPVPRQ